MKYKIGQWLTAKKDIELEKALSGEVVKIPKGNKIIIGADKFGHHPNGMIQPVADDVIVEGYDAGGLAVWIYRCLRCQFEIERMIEDEDMNIQDFVEAIESALEEIGFA